MSFTDFRTQQRTLTATEFEEMLADSRTSWEEVAPEHPEGVDAAFVGYAEGGWREGGETMIFAESFARGSTTLFNINIGRCRSDTATCSSELTHATLARRDQTLVEGAVSVVRVLSGDEGHDGDTDFLVQLSNGAAIMVRRVESGPIPRGLLEETPSARRRIIHPDN